MWCHYVGVVIPCLDHLWLVDCLGGGGGTEKECRQLAGASMVAGSQVELFPQLSLMVVLEGTGALAIYPGPVKVQWCW